MRSYKWLGLAVAYLMLASPFAATAADPIRLGVPGAHTGDLAGYGIPALNAARLVVDKVNAAGGINGRMVELIAQDDQCKPEMAVNAARRLVTANVDIIMGATCSGATRAALPIYEDRKIVSMSPSATHPTLTQSGDFPRFFRTTPSDDAQARLNAEFAIKGLNAKRIAILHDRGDYGRGLAEYVRRFVEEDGTAEVVFFEGITPGAVSYSPTVRSIRRAEADTLIFGGYYPEASKLLTDIRASRMNINFVSADGVKTDAFLKLVGPAGEGVYASSSRDSSHLPIAQEARAAHIAAFGSNPGQFFENAYAATQALLNAVEKAGSTDSEAIMHILRTEYVDTPIGKIRFDAKGDCYGEGFAMFKVVDGRFVQQDFELEE